MSFILDALKKSENERQRTIGPSLADAPIRRPQSDKPWWAFVIGALLIVNIGVLVFALTRNSEPAPVAAPAPMPATATVQSAPKAAPTASQPTSTPRTASSNPSVRSLAEEADASYSADDIASEPESDPYPPEEADLAAAASVPEGPPMVRPIDQPAAEPLPTQRAADDEILPTATSLIASGIPLPEMRLDIHVYSNTPRDRFVFINMRKYTEGQVIAEGPTLERVTPDGAVLNHQGTRFLLPRQ